jgi:hypothetical protein
MLQNPSDSISEWRPPLLLSFPSELLGLLFTGLDVFDRYRLSRVCERFRRLLQDAASVLWLLARPCDPYDRAHLDSGGVLQGGWRRVDQLPARLLYGEACNDFALRVEKFSPGWVVGGFSAECGLYRLGGDETVHFYWDCGLVVENVKERGYSRLHWVEAQELRHRGLFPLLVINK